MENNVSPLSATPSTGTAKILVIPVWFTDSDSYISSKKKESVRNDIYTAYFGTNEETGWRSVKTYYEEESHGALTYTGTVSEWYECGKSEERYHTDGSYPGKTMTLVSNATAWYFSHHDENRRDYDGNHDGYLDGVVLIYGAPDYSAARKYDRSNMWAYTYWMQDSSLNSILEPGENVFFWASYDFMYSPGTPATNHTGVPTKPYGSGDTKHCNIDAHTYIHEMGHMFGLDDYYDYSGQFSPAGGFSMQDKNVGGHDPFSILSLGWGKAYIPTESVNINLKPLSTTGEMIILSPNWNEFNSPFDEYLVLEYFTPTGVNEFDSTYNYRGSSPAGSKKSGIRLWHIDARLLYANSELSSFSINHVTTDPSSELGRVTLMMTNTYEIEGQESGYITYLGSDYADYKLLKYVRNDKTIETHKTTDQMKESNLFKKGDSFTMSQYGSQFVETGKLNSDLDLGFSFSVVNIKDEYASITIAKL